MQKKYNGAGDYERRSTVAHTLFTFQSFTLLLQHSSFHGSVVAVSNPVTFPFHWSTLEVHNTCTYCTVYEMQSCFWLTVKTKTVKASLSAGDIMNFNVHHLEESGLLIVTSGSLILVLVLMFQQRKGECGIDTHIKLCTGIWQQTNIVDTLYSTSQKDMYRTVLHYTKKVLIHFCNTIQAQSYTVYTIFATQVCCGDFVIVSVRNVRYCGVEFIYVSTY